MWEQCSEGQKAQGDLPEDPSVPLGGRGVFSKKAIPSGILILIRRAFGLRRGAIQVARRSISSDSPGSDFPAGKKSKEMK